MEPGGEHVGIFREGGGFFCKRTEDVLADFLGELAMGGAAEGGVVNEPHVALRQLAEGGFVTVGGEGQEE